RGRAVLIVLPAAPLALGEGTQSGVMVDAVAATVGARGGDALKVRLRDARRAHGGVFYLGGIIGLFRIDLRGVVLAVAGANAGRLPVLRLPAGEAAAGWFLKARDRILIRPRSRVRRGGRRGRRGLGKVGHGKDPQTDILVASVGCFRLPRVLVAS